MESPKKNGGRPDGHDDPVVELLSRVGPRPELPEHRQEQIKASVSRHWKKTLRARSRRRWAYGGGALAAAVLILAVTVSVVQQGEPVGSPVGPVATVEAVSGPVTILEEAMAGSGRVPRRLDVGMVLPVDAEIDTTSIGRVALRLQDGSSMRVDRETRIHLASASTIDLRAGRVYVDSESGSGQSLGLEVHTALGTVRDIGTQFEVSSTDESLRVRVREGEVHIGARETTHRVLPGEEVSLEASGALERRAIPGHGPEWTWMQRIAPPFDLEGRSLQEFLDWVTRESGWTIDFDDEATAAEALTVVLHGSISGLSAEEALQAVLPTCGMEHRVDDGRLLIGQVEGSTGDH